jgi:hypothetical protein
MDRRADRSSIRCGTNPSECLVDLMFLMRLGLVKVPGPAGEGMAVTPGAKPSIGP